ncbi:hypothetical protein BsWGS_20523 [Bradybaena similaris]
MWNILTGLLVLSALSIAAALKVYTGEFRCGHSDNWGAIPSDDGKQKTRESAFTITFPQSFIAPPSVLMSVTSLDADQGKNLRYSTRLTEHTARGFRGSCFTWWDTIIYSMRVHWIAVGA